MASKHTINDTNNFQSPNYPHSNTNQIGIAAKSDVWLFKFGYASWNQWLELDSNTQKIKFSIVVEYSV